NFYDSQGAVGILQTYRIGAAAPVSADMRAHLAPHEIYEALSGKPAPDTLRTLSVAEASTSVTNPEAPALEVPEPPPAVASDDVSSDGDIHVSREALAD